MSIADQEQWMLNNITLSVEVIKELQAMVGEPLFSQLLGRLSPKEKEAIKRWL